MHKIFIIAEAGVNHNGSLETARKLIDAAKACGADAVKFQSFCAERLVAQHAPRADYQIQNTGSSGSQFEMLKGLELSESDHKELMNDCKKKNILFMSTPFDTQSADLLDRLGMQIFKIPSGEITDKPLIQHIASKARPILLSTGMADLEEVKKAVGWIYDIWQIRDCKPSLTLLHCISNYPARTEDVNLMALKTMEAAFKVPVGYSDHTLGIAAAIAAAALGARVIEKHLTLDKRMPGPDHKASSEPGEFKNMVDAVRDVERALGDGRKRPVKSEEEIRKLSRKSLVAARDIRAGEAIKKEDIAIKRPGTGIAPEFRDEIAYKRARVDIKKDALFEQNHFC